MLNAPEARREYRVWSRRNGGCYLYSLYVRVLLTESDVRFIYEIPEKYGVTKEGIV